MLNKIKKIFILLLSILLIINLSSCARKANIDVNEKTVIEELNICIGPGRDENILLTYLYGESNDQINNEYRGLDEQLYEGLLDYGYEVNNINIYVAQNEDELLEDISIGNADIFFINADLYLKGKEAGGEILLKALRFGVAGEDKDVCIKLEDGIDGFNSKGIIQASNERTNGYSSLIYVNTATEIGSSLYEKAINDTLTLNDLNEAEWFVGVKSSKAGYLYPSIWLNDHFGEGVGLEKIALADLENVRFNGSYIEMVKALINEETDICVSYADARIDNTLINTFNEKYEDLDITIYDTIKVIGVSDYIMNDAVLVSSEAVDDKMTPDLIYALNNVLINIGETKEGISSLSALGYKGFMVGKDSDYDPVRKELNIID